jgi:hypothetical protein
MQSLRRRIERLEHRSVATNENGMLLIVMQAGQEVAPDDPCIEAIRECRSRSKQILSLVVLGEIPDDVDAETERFLRGYDWAKRGEDRRLPKIEVTQA